jgi:hypothetical protein
MESADEAHVAQKENNHHSTGYCSEESGTYCYCGCIRCLNMSGKCVCVKCPCEKK